MNIDTLTAKQAAGKAAADLIHDGMSVGLGTGSTAACFIASLIERCRNGLTISAVATSERSAKQAHDGGIPLLDINTLQGLDIIVDGADEIDYQKRMIKGGGGALLREKIVATMARERVIIIDQSKLVNQIGSFPLPVEIIPFAHTFILNRIQALGYQAKMRHHQADGSLYITDNSNYIVDIHFSTPPHSPEEEHAAIRAIPGVVDTGFFFNLAQKVIIGYEDGSIQYL